MKLRGWPNEPVKFGDILNLLILMSLIFQFFGIMIINFTIFFYPLFVKTGFSSFYSSF